jgi:hypothetical protein
MLTRTEATAQLKNMPEPDGGLTTPDPGKNNRGDGPHLPTMPDPTNDPERGQEFPTEPDPTRRPDPIDDPMNDPGTGDQPSKEVV